MPWQWDYDHYTGDNSDMVGFFYPEDIATIKQIIRMESVHAQREADEAKRKARSR